MGEKTKENPIVPYKILRKPSPMPYLAAGFAFLMIGAASPIAAAHQYAIAALFSAGTFAVSRLVWPGKRIKIELPPDTGDAQTNQLLVEAREALVAIRTANDKIPDAAVSECIDGIEASCLAILKRLEEDIALFGQLRTFLRYYLPTTRKILDARAAIEADTARGESWQKVMARTDRVLPEIQRAFSKQLEALDKHRFLDLQVEMDVLEGMLKSDGLSN